MDQMGSISIGVDIVSIERISENIDAIIKVEEENFDKR